MLSSLRQAVTAVTSLWPRRRSLIPGRRKARRPSQYRRTTKDKILGEIGSQEWRWHRTPDAEAVRVVAGAEEAEEVVAEETDAGATAVVVAVLADAEVTAMAIAEVAGTDIAEGAKADGEAEVAEAVAEAEAAEGVARMSRHPRKINSRRAIGSVPAAETTTTTRSRPAETSIVGEP